MTLAMIYGEKLAADRNRWVFGMSIYGGIKKCKTPT
jgi:hypothetical protein